MSEPLASSEGARLARQIPGLSQLRLLGEGGFAWVFGAATAEGQAVAVKIARAAGDPRFDRERAALAHLAPPLVPALRRVGAVDGHPFLVMEQIDAPLLSAWLAAAPADAGRAALAVDAFEPVARAVNAVHAAGIVHRDLKPDNLFVRDDGQVTLIDFGLARARGAAGPDGFVAELTATGVQLGTAAYMAPEQCAGDRAVDAPADRYAAGVILFEMLTGRLPFEGDRAAIEDGHLSRRPPAVSPLIGAPPALDEVLSRALAKAPGDRFPSLADLARAARAALAAPASAPATRPRSSRRPVVLLAIDTRRPVDEVADAARHDDGEVARLTERGYVLAFPTLPPARGVAAARATAERLRADRAVIHVATLRVRTGARSGLVGSALEAVNAWAGQGGDSAGIHLTDAAREAAPDEVAPALAETAAEVPLVGRDALIVAVREEGRRCLTEARPTLTTLIGDVGSGKSRILQALAPAGARVLSLRAGDSGSGSLLDPIADTLAYEGTAAAGDASARQLRARALGEALLAQAADRPTVVLVDDAHRADLTSLDALELATMAGRAVPLWIVVTATPQLHELREAWGHRAGHSSEHRLDPLDEIAARELLLFALRPVEYLPAALAAQLLELAGGVPLFLIEIARALRASGAIRRQPGTDAWFVSAPELAQRSTLPIGERLAARIVEALPPELRRIAELAAVLGPRLRAADLDAVQRETDHGQLASSVALDRLVRAGLLRPDGPGAFAFHHPILRDGVNALTASATRRNLHAAALRLGRAHGWSPSRLARHAVACGDSEIAAACAVEAAERAAAGFRFARAEQFFGIALEHLPAGDAAARRRALARRAATLVGSGRLADSLTDLEQASELARESGDAAAQCDLLLQRATLLDWMQRFAEASTEVDRAVALAVDLDDDGVRARCQLGRGRSAFRDQDLATADTLLDDAAALARSAGDHETEIEALVTLAPVLVYADQLERAEARFADAIELCERRGDRLHLAVCYLNRTTLWMRRGDYERARQDGAACRTVALELGHFQLERAAHYNLAELLLWMGRTDEAWPLARVPHEMQMRYVGEPFPEDQILCARIAAARGDHAAAAEALAWVAEHCDADAISPSQQLLVRMVELTCADYDAVAWERLCAASAQASVLDEQLEILLLRAQQAIHGGTAEQADRALAAAAERADRSSVWKARLLALR